MNDYLVFTLASAFGAMGDLAGHERRGTLPWPGRSAILGLLGAGGGIEQPESTPAQHRDPHRQSMAD